MSKTAMVFFSLMLVLASCFIAGCSSLPFSGSPAPTETSGKVNAGLTEHDNSVPALRYRIDDAKSAIFSPDSASKWNDTPVNESQENVYPEKHIKLIRGTDIDENGDAGSWTFIIEHGDQLSFVTYNNKGTTISSSTGTIKRPDILIDQIVTPRELFEKNRAVIFDTTRTGTDVTRDLSLNGESYTLTISGRGSPRILVFDAKTGALTSSND